MNEWCHLIDRSVDWWCLNDNESIFLCSTSCLQIDQPDLLIPIEWNNETKRSQVETQVSDRPCRCLFMSPPHTDPPPNFLSLSLLSRHCGPSCPPVRGTWPYWGPLMTRVSTTWDTSCLCPLNLQSLLHRRGIACRKDNCTSACPSEISRYGPVLTHVHMSPPVGGLFTQMSPQLQAPDIDWLGCLQTTFEPLNITEDDQVFVHNLPFMVNMSLIVRKWKNKPENSNL